MTEQQCTVWEIEEQSYWWKMTVSIFFLLKRTGALKRTMSKHWNHTNLDKLPEKGHSPIQLWTLDGAGSQSVGFSMI